jgi:hypothetical protein
MRLMIRMMLLMMLLMQALAADDHRRRSHTVCRHRLPITVDDTATVD